MIPEIDADDTITSIPQLGSSRQQVRRTGTTFPAMNHHGNSFRPLRLRWRVMAQQPYPFTAIENLITGRGDSATGEKRKSAWVDAQAPQ